MSRSIRFFGSMSVERMSALSPRLPSLDMIWNDKIPELPPHLDLSSIPKLPVRKVTLLFVPASNDLFDYLACFPALEAVYVCPP